MIFRHLRCAALLCAATCLASIHAQKVTKDLTYTTGSDDAQRGDLYQPVGPGPFPAIVYIHGGSWRSGDKKIYDKLAVDLAASGYAGFSIDYDLHPHSFPVSFEQAQAAVRFLRKHAAEYRIDPNQIAVAGDSAGGELAALVALAPEGPEALKDSAPNETSATVSAAIILNGVFRLTTDFSVVARYLGVTCQAQPAVCKDASPFDHIHAGAPPFFVGHGTGDHTVPYSEAELFIHALQEQHVPVSTYAAKGGRHEYWKKSEFYAPNLAAVKSFLAGALHPAAPSNP
jgi:acetyl esterase/lipase